MGGMSARLRRIGVSRTFGAVALIATVVLFKILDINSDCNGTSVKNFCLQLAWTVKNATAIIEPWRGACNSQAANQVWLDYLFIPAYVSFLFFIGLRAKQAAERRGMSSLAVVAKLSTWGALFAGLFDCLENVGLLVMILKGPASIVWPVPSLTSLFSTLKWLLILSSGFVGVIVLVRVIVYRWKQQGRAPVTAK